MQPTARPTTRTPPRPLSPEELALLRTVRLVDEDDGGLAFEDLDEDGLATLRALAYRGLVEIRQDEAGDGFARINARGVEALRAIAD